MTYRPQDHHDRILDVEKKVHSFRNTNATQINSGVSSSPSVFGIGSLNGLNGGWSILPTYYNVGSFNGSNVFVNDTADSNGLYHIVLTSTSAIVTGSASSLTLSYIDGLQGNGQFIILRCATGKSLTLKKAGATDISLGNIYLDADLSIDDHHTVILQFFNDVGTGAGKYIVLSGMGGGSGSTIPWSNVTPIDVDKDMNNHTLSNINTLTFHSSTATQPFITSDGNDKVINASIHSFDILELSNAFGGVNIPDNGFLELLGSAHGTYQPIIGVNVIYTPAFKTFCTSSVLSNGDPIGSFHFDAYNSILSQLSFGIIRGIVRNKNSGTEQGEIDFLLINNGVQNTYAILNSAAFQLQNTGLGFIGNISQTGWTSACYPQSDAGEDLGINSGTLARWANLYMSGNFLNYEVGSTNKFIEIFKSNSNHNVTYILNDTINNIGHDFLKNGLSVHYAGDDGIFHGTVSHYQVTSVTAGSYSASNTFEIYFCDCSSGGVTITLPAISGTYAGRTYRFIKTDSSGNNVTINSSGSDTINGATSQTISSQYGKINVINNGVHLWGIF